MSRVRVAWAAILVRVTLAGLAPLAARADAGIEIRQIGRHFAIEAVRIDRGATIRFVNADDFDHQIFVDSAGFTFDSDEQPPGQTVSVTFDRAGTFAVRCHIHPKMHLSVTVSEPG